MPRFREFISDRETVGRAHWNTAGNASNKAKPRLVSCFSRHSDRTFYSKDGDGQYFGQSQGLEKKPFETTPSAESSVLLTCSGRSCRGMGDGCGATLRQLGIRGGLIRIIHSLCAWPCVGFVCIRVPHDRTMSRPMRRVPT